MNIIGEWRIKYLKSDFLGEHLVQDIEQEYLNAEGEEKREKEQMYNMRFIFKEDGTVTEAMILSDSVTEEQIQEAIAEGEKIEGRLYIGDTKLWKEEDGKFFSQVSADPSSTTPDGNIDKDAFGEIKIEDDMLVVNAIFGNYYLVKA